MVAFMPDPQTLFTVSAWHTVGEPGAPHGLACRRLLQSGADDVAHDDFVDGAVVNAGRRSSAARMA